MKTEGLGKGVDHVPKVAHQVVPARPHTYGLKEILQRYRHRVRTVTVSIHIMEYLNKNGELREGIKCAMQAEQRYSMNSF